MHGRCTGGAREVRGRCAEGARKVRGRCAGGAREVRGRCAEGAQKVKCQSLFVLSYHWLPIATMEIVGDTREFEI